MDAAQYTQATAIFNAAIDLDVADRAAYIAAEVGSDAALGHLVASLVEQVEAPDSANPLFAETRLRTMRSRLDGLLDAAVDPPVRPPTTALHHPAQIGGYRIVRHVATGGMGSVYEAQQDSPRRRVALKLIPAHRATPDRLRRFRQEADLLGRLRHPGIAQIHEAGVFDLGEGAQPYFAMEFIDGRDVRTYADDEDLTPRERFILIADIARAVHHAHEAGIVHRDLKPDNVLVDEHGTAKVLDFGVARATETSAAISTVVTHAGQVVGTLGYMSPEQLTGDPDAVTARADVYALGVMAYELLAGRLPHDIEGLPTTVALRVLTESTPVPLGTIDAKLTGDPQTIVGRALHKDPVMRYDSAIAFADDIDRMLDHRPIVARPPSALYVIRTFTRRHRTVAVGAAATIVALVAGTIVSLMFAHSANTQRQAALDRSIEALENEARSIGALLESSRALLNSDDPLGARVQHQAVPEHARDWAWDLVGRGLPLIRANQRTRHRDHPWMFLDRDRLVRLATDEDRIHVWDVAADARRFRFSGYGFELVRGIDRSRVMARRGTELCLLDLDREVIVDRWPIPEGADFRSCGRPDVLAFASPSGGWTVVNGSQVDRFPDAQLVTISWDGKRVGIQRGQQEISQQIVDLTSGSTLFQFTSDTMTTVAHVDDAIIYFDHEIGARKRVDFGPDGPRERVLEQTTQIPSDSAISSHGNVIAMAGGAVGPRPRLIDARVGGPNLASRWQDEDGRIRHAAGRNDGVSLSPDGSRLALIGSYSPTWLIDIDPAEREPDFNPYGQTIAGHTQWIYHVAVSHDGSMIATAAPLDPLIRLWDATTATPIATVERRVDQTQSWDCLMAFTPDDDQLIFTSPFADAELAIVQWNLVSGDVEVAPVAKTLVHATLLDPFLERLDPGPRARLSQRAQMFGQKAFAVHTPFDNRLAEPLESTKQGGTRWSLLPGAAARSIGIRSLSVHPTEHTVATVESVPLGGTEGSIVFETQVGHLRLIDLDDGTVQHERELSHAPWCVAYSPDGSLLAVGTQGGDVLLFETTFYQPRIRFPAHDDYVFSVAWTPDGTRLITVSGDRTVGIWDGRFAPRAEAEDDAWRRRLEHWAGTEELPRPTADLTPDDRSAIRIVRLRRSARGVSNETGPRSQ